MNPSYGSRTPATETAFLYTLPMPVPVTRTERFAELFPKVPKFRARQIEEAVFSPHFKSWQDVTVFPKPMREVIAREIPWISVEASKVLESKRGDTFKALLKGSDGQLFETVLMANAKDQWTVCVSSQIGCAMGCVFCATGAMGFKRNLSSDEIADQIRFWNNYLLHCPVIPSRVEERTMNTHCHPSTPLRMTMLRISNVVFMGMGEPFNNIENVKKAIHLWTTYADIGPTHITLSTVGILPALEKVLTDPDWPNVRIAVSLHSADQKRRTAIVPSTVPDFLTKLATWCKRYEVEKGNRRHYVTFEYTLISGVNDSLDHARELVRYIKSAGAPKLNVIPLNPVSGKIYFAAKRDNIEAFKAEILRHGLDVTERRTMGEDIAAACGQLAAAE